MNDTFSYKTPVTPPKIPVRVIDLPRGARTIRSMHAPVRLAELRFDPIDNAVKLIHDVNRRLNFYNELLDRKMANPEFDLRSGGYSSVSHNEMLALKQKAINDLMRYGYARVSEVVQEAPQKEPPKFSIVLNGIQPTDVKVKNETTYDISG
jgi:hypothetical protein